MAEPKGNVWFGTSAGLKLRRVNGKWTKVALPGIKDTVGIDAMALENRKELWLSASVAPYNDRGLGVLVRYGNGSWRRYTTGDGLLSNKVNAIMVDRAGNKWFGTDAGVSKLNADGTWVNYTVKDGLADDRVNAIVQDRNGDLWFATEAGISRLKELPVKTPVGNGKKLPDGQEVRELIEDSLKEIGEPVPDPLEGLAISKSVFRAANRPGVNVEQGRQIIMQAAYETGLGSLIELSPYLEAEPENLPQKLRNYVFIFNNRDNKWPGAGLLNNFIVTYVDYKNLQHYLLVSPTRDPRDEVRRIGRQEDPGYYRALSGWAFERDGLASGDYGRLFANLAKNKEIGLEKFFKTWQPVAYERGDDGYYRPVTKGKGLGGRPIKSYKETPQLP